MGQERASKIFPLGDHSDLEYFLTKRIMQKQERMVIWINLKLQKRLNNKLEND